MGDGRCAGCGGRRGAIRAFEAEQRVPARHRWQVVVALILGGILLGAGVFALPWLTRWVRPGGFGGGYPYETPSVLTYVVVAVTAMVFVWWGVRERSRAVVNFGIAAFAITVGWFYFSSLMDRLGRSLGLIGLGILFLLGGWLLERFRRRLMEQVRSEPGAGAMA